MARKKAEIDESIQPLCLSVDECQLVSSVSKWTWRQMAYSGRIESVKLGARLLIPVSEVHRVLNEGRRPRRDGLAAGVPSVPKSRQRDRIVTVSNSGRGVHV